MSRYVIISDYPFDERLKKRFGCDKMDGYEPLCIQPNDKCIDGWIGRLRPTDIVVVDSRLNNARHMFRLLTKHKVRYSTISICNVPVSSMRTWQSALSLKEYIRLKLQDIGSVIGRWREFLLTVAKHNFEFLRLRPPQYWLTAGSVAWPTHPYANMSFRAKRIKVASFDSPAAQAALNGMYPSYKKFAVFLDEFNEGHLDFDNPPVTPTQYWEDLGRLFWEIEVKFGLRVVVAPHPKRTTKSPWPAGFGNTAELVRDCSLVLAHCSTSIGFAVMFHKPIIFVTTDEIERSPVYRDHVIRMSSNFGQKRINANHIKPEDLTIPNVDWKTYQDYRTKYVEDSREGPCVQFYEKLKGPAT